MLRSVLKAGGLPDETRVLDQSRQTAAPSGNFQQQIERLQQRHVDLVRQTTMELEELKHALPQSVEMEQLRVTVHSLEEENLRLQAQNAQAVATLESLLSTLESARILTAPPVVKKPRRLVIETEDRPAAYAAVLPAETAPVPLAAIAAPAVKPPSKKELRAAVKAAAKAKKEKPPVTAVVEPTMKKEKKKRGGLRRLATLCVLGGIMYAGWHTAAGQSVASASDTDGQVAGVSTAPLSIPTATPDPYAESFAEIPFSQTVWATVTDTDFGIKLDYPKNTTNKVRVVGGSNLWFLRKNGYLMKISLIDSTEPLDQWWKENQATYAAGLPATKVTFKGMPAWYATSTEKTQTSGSSYFLAHGTEIYQIWIKDEPATTDDGQRLTRMVDSLTFIN